MNIIRFSALYVCLSFINNDRTARYFFSPHNIWSRISNDKPSRLLACSALQHLHINDPVLYTAAFSTNLLISRPFSLFASALSFGYILYLVCLNFASCVRLSVCDVCIFCAAVGHWLALLGIQVLFLLIWTFFLAWRIINRYLVCLADWQVGLLTRGFYTWNTNWMEGHLQVSRSCNWLV